MIIHRIESEHSISIASERATNLIQRGWKDVCLIALPNKLLVLIELQRFNMIFFSKLFDLT